MTEAIVVRPDAPPGVRPSGWWGMILLIATEATLFALLLAAYFYLRFTTDGAWPPDGLADPKIVQPLVATLVLVVAALPFVWAASAADGLRPAAARLGLLAGIVLGTGYLVYQYVLIQQSLDRFGPHRDAYGSIFYTLLGLHFVHVVAGVLLAAWALGRSLRFDRTAVLTVRVTALYWIFLVVVGVAVFLALYVGPRA